MTTHAPFDPSNYKFVQSAQHLGGAGTKDLYKDINGKLFLFKHATPKFGKTGFEPFRIYAQTISNFVARELKPHACLDVFKAEFKGIPGVLQSFIDAKPVNGSEYELLTQLEPFEIHDIAVEHLVDWLCSQHDSHIGQWLEKPDGHLVCCDREQAYKYFGKDKLSVDYHPNSVYGERPPLYNKFWTMWADGKISYDVRLLDESFCRLSNPDFKIPFIEHLGAYAESNPFIADKGAFVVSACKRLLAIRSDFESFWADLKG